MSAFSPKIRLGEIGTIVAGPDRGTSVRALDDRAETGGFVILAWNDERGFDKWAKDLDAVERFFEASGWTVQWRPQDGAPGQDRAGRDDDAIPPSAL